jgi:WD repeat-containing protein 40A
MANGTFGQLLRYGVETGVFSEVALGEGRPVNNGPESCGIHTITASPEGRLVASGGVNVNDCVVYELPQLRPVVSLQAHSDWIFGTAWLDELTVVTASRDATAMIWSLRGDHGCQLVQKSPRATLTSHRTKIRSCVACRPLDTFATLSIDGLLKLWDSNSATEVRTIELAEKKELSCLTPTLSSHHEIAVGSKAHFALVDVRMHSATRSIKWLDVERVRSISWLSNVLIVGGAMTFQVGSQREAH